jgi:HK97 family phage major capsid protein
MVTIPTHEQYAQPVATQKMLDDATFNVETWISGKVTSKFSRTENTAFVTGDGVKKPTGFLAYADWATAGTYERNALETRETGTASTIKADDLIDLQTDLIEYYQAGASWVMARKTWAEIMKLKDAVDGNYLLNPAMMFQGSLGLQLLGKPVTLFADMPTIADAAIPLAYGDFGEGYTILDRIGIRVLRDPYTAKGKVKFYTTKRVGGKVTNYQAIKRLKIKSA